jgi:polyhydroxybutyrate depolymerase
MRCTKAIAVILLLSVSAAVYSDSVMQRYTLDHEGLQREYFVYVPPGTIGPLQVVVGLHGYTGTATGFAYAHRLNAHAAANGYMVLYPQGTHFLVAEQSDAPVRISTWNSYAKEGPDFSAAPHCTAESYQYPCPPGCGECHRCQWEPCTNDVAFIDKMLDAVQANIETDTSRYYVLGVSNGGMLATRLACDLAERFAAAAPIIALQPPGHACGPNSDLPVLFLMGALDETIRYDGKAGKDDGFIYATLAESTRIYADAMQCKSGPAAWPADLADAAGVECTAYSDCREKGHEVVSCLDPTGSHVWPRQGTSGSSSSCVAAGQSATMPEKALCEPVGDNGPHAGMDLVWSFFKRYRRD